MGAYKYINVVELGHTKFRGIQIFHDIGALMPMIGAGASAGVSAGYLRILNMRTSTGAFSFKAASASPGAQYLRYKQDRSE